MLKCKCYFVIRKDCQIMNSLNNTKIILASQSPRRRELLAQAGYEFEIITSDVEEVTTKEAPDEVVKELSHQKAKAVFDGLISYSSNMGMDDDLHLVVIGADTVVSLDGKIMGKPKNKEEAFHMLKSLQGNTHQVYTGVTLFFYDYSNKLTEVKSFAECTNVTFYPMKDSEILGYIATGDCYDKAGSYGIQGSFAIFIEKIDGDYNNVVGLPIARLYHELL